MPATIEEIYKIHRDYVEHEDELVHHRMTTLITIQSFLLATFGFTYQKKYEIAERLFEHDPKLSLSVLGSITDEYNGFLLVLAVVGLGTSFIAFRSIKAATNAITELEKSWLRAANHQPPDYLPGLTGGGNATSSATGITLSTWAPMFLVALWLVTLFVMILVFKVGLK